MDLGLGGQVALVAAASRGLGKAAALALAREGARLAVLARSEQIRATADEIRRETGAEVLAIQGDVLQPADIERAVAETLKEYGQIDILIVNAGGPRPGEFLDLAPSQQEEDIRLLAPNLLEQLQRKLDITNAHWLHYRRLFTTPN